MLKKLLVCLLALFLWASAGAEEPPALQMGEGPLLFIAACPGDETLAFAGTMMTAAQSGREVTVLFLTAGDEEKSDAALAALGLTAAKVVRLGHEAGTLGEICLSGGDGGLGAVLAEVRPTDVFLPSRYDGHPDAVAAHLLTLRGVAAAGEDYAPVLHETILRGYDDRKWPLRLTRTQNKKLPIAREFTDPFPKSGLPFDFDEADRLLLTQEMVLAKDAAVAVYAAGMGKTAREHAFAFVKSEEFSWAHTPFTQAQDVTMNCVFTLGGKTKKVPDMTDRSYKTYHAIKKGGVIDVQSPLEKLTGVFIQFYDHCSVMAVEAELDGAWVAVGETRGTYLCEWFPLPEGVRRVRMTNRGKNRALLAEVTLYGEGSRPARSPQWHTLQKADLMLLVAHPDDELLWFGGLLPEYAGQRGLAVQVMYLVPATPNRRLELLDGLWHCGVDAYPLFAGLRDAKAYDLEGQYGYWSRPQLLKKIIGTLRQMKPEVLVTHDVNGEYGHGGHRAAADICVQAVPLAADASKYSDSADMYGAWQVKKLYLHLYPENQLRLDWRQPLERFGGRDGFTVASEALAFHVSQIRHGWGMEEGGEHDNALHGLQFTTVGPDVEKNDLMENIPAEALSGAAT